MNLKDASMCKDFVEAMQASCETFHVVRLGIGNECAQHKVFLTCTCI